MLHSYANNYVNTLKLPKVSSPGLPLALGEVSSKPAKQLADPLTPGRDWEYTPSRTYRLSGARCTQLLKILDFGPYPYTSEGGSMK